MQVKQDHNQNTDYRSLMGEHAEIDETQFVGITKKHWKPASLRTQCMNKKCGKKFSFTDRPHHCWRCGDLFCRPCIQYRRKLNNLANLDPQGKPYDVCGACFEIGRTQTIGQTTDLTKLYKFLKDNNRKLQTMLVDQGRYLQRENFDMSVELKRLKEGFKRDVGKSSIKKTFHEFKSLMKTPDWMRAPRYQVAKYTDTCFDCQEKFGIFKKSYDCSVCGEMYCVNCSSCDLLLYIPDDEKTREDSDVIPLLAVIKIVGCPENEPDISLYLRVCNSCQSTIKTRQVDEYYGDRLLASMDDPWREINTLYEKAANRKRKIEEYLPKYQDLVGSFEDASLGPKSGSDNRSVIQMLAKAQEDLSDHLTQLIVVCHEVTKAKPSTDGQKIILKNMSADVISYYQQNMFIFRELKKKLESFTPLSVLEAIQGIVEKNTINSAYLSIKQLGYEVLHLSLKYELGNEIPEKIAQVDEVLLQELKARVEKAMEDWESHQKAINELLQIQLKQHRIIRPSKRMTAVVGKKYIHQFILERGDAILHKIRLQLSAKCADKSFVASKDALEELFEFVVILEKGKSGT